MTPQETKVIRELRDRGYAIVIFTPEELEDSYAGDVEDIMIERGCNYIKDMSCSE